tara:strand:+ start:2155 stop:2649 length:495 start_codon:yes stop_codon:yes gene_type:complete
MSYSLKDSSVLMNSYLRAMATDIASRLPFDIVVTSGIRTAREQAIAMKNKLEAGENLADIYKDDQYALDVTEAYPSLEAMTAVTARYADAGKGSKHTAGQGLDLRTWDASHVQPMINAVNAAGHKPSLEVDHLHVGGIKTYGTEKKSYLILAILAAGALWMYKK